MSRKSARIQCRSKQDQENPCPAKRRKTEEANAKSMACTTRRQQFCIQNNKMVLSGENIVISSCSIVASSQSEAITCVTPPKPVAAEGGAHCLTPPPSASRYRFQNHFATPPGQRQCPLPLLSWANREEVWNVMLAQEERYPRKPNMFERHPSLQPRMRAILLDWLMEVCEVYSLHRETYHLAMNFVDRYIAQQVNLDKSQLQLIGITALFMAAKLEEIYPPKLHDFAYVTDEACEEDGIMQMELIMLKALDWRLSPITAVTWLRLYLQLASTSRSLGAQASFIFPQFSGHDFVQISRLLDFAMMDIECLKFPTNHLAATAFYLLSRGDFALTLSKLSLADLQPCIMWMNTYKSALMVVGDIPAKFSSQVKPEDSHLIQRHSVTLDMFDQVMQSLSYEPMRLPVTIAPNPNPHPQHPVPTFCLDLTPPADEDNKIPGVEDLNLHCSESPNLDASVYELPDDISDCDGYDGTPS